MWSESIWQFRLEINHCTLPVLSEHGTLHFRDYGAGVIVGLRTSEEVLNYLSLIVTVMSELFILFHRVEVCSMQFLPLPIFTHMAMEKTPQEKKKQKSPFKLVHLLSWMQLNMFPPKCVKAAKCIFSSSCSILITGLHNTLEGTYYLPASASSQTPTIRWCLCNWQGGESMPSRLL